MTALAATPSSAQRRTGPVTPFGQVQRPFNIASLVGSVASRIEVSGATIRPTNLGSQPRKDTADAIVLVDDVKVWNDGGRTYYGKFQQCTRHPSNDTECLPHAVSFKQSCYIVWPECAPDSPVAQLQHVLALLDLQQRSCANTIKVLREKCQSTSALNEDRERLAQEETKYKSQPIDLLVSANVTNEFLRRRVPELCVLANVIPWPPNDPKKTADSFAKAGLARGGGSMGASSSAALGSSGAAAAAASSSSSLTDSKTKTSTVSPKTEEELRAQVPEFLKNPIVANAVVALMRIYHDSQKHPYTIQSDDPCQISHNKKSGSKELTPGTSNLVHFYEMRRAVRIEVDQLPTSLANYDEFNVQQYIKVTPFFSYKEHEIKQMIQPHLNFAACLMMEDYDDCLPDEILALNGRRRTKALLTAAGDATATPPQQQQQLPKLRPAKNSYATGRILIEPSGDRLARLFTQDRGLSFSILQTSFEPSSLCFESKTKKKSIVASLRIPGTMWSERLIINDDDGDDDANGNEEEVGDGSGNNNNNNNVAADGTTDKNTAAASSSSMIVRLSATPIFAKVTIWSKQLSPLFGFAENDLEPWGIFGPVLISGIPLLVDYRCDLERSYDLLYMANKYPKFVDDETERHLRECYSLEGDDNTLQVRDASDKELAVALAAQGSGPAIVMELQAQSVLADLEAALRYKIGFPVTSKVAAQILEEFIKPAQCSHVYGHPINNERILLLNAIKDPARSSKLADNAADKYDFFVVSSALTAAERENLAINPLTLDDTTLAFSRSYRQMSPKERAKKASDNLLCYSCLLPENLGNGKSYFLLYAVRKQSDGERRADEQLCRAFALARGAEKMKKTRMTAKAAAAATAKATTSTAMDVDVEADEPPQQKDDQEAPAHRAGGSGGDRGKKRKLPTSTMKTSLAAKGAPMTTSPKKAKLEDLSDGRY